MSRRPKPTELKLLQGRPGHHPINRLEPKPLKGVPGALEALTEPARVHFDRMSEQLTATRVLTVNDGIVLSVTAQSTADYEEATNELAKAGKVVRTERGLVKNPWTTIQKQAFDQMMKGLLELGLTPASRSKIQVTAEDPEANPFANLA